MFDVIGSEDANGEKPSSSLPSISPDIVEQEQGAEFDNIIPTRAYHLLPVVALGGSAGSIPALQHFFTAMPPDSGQAFVVVLHLAPEHESIMPEILSRATTMKVFQANDGQLMEPNTVYVIPPGKFLSAADGHLRLAPLEPEHGKRVAIDLFFRTLADTHGPNAAAVILSGADGDGAIGIKRMKERGGLTVAQDPDEAEHPSMPRTAIDTGMVDWILPVAEMPKRLLEYRANAKHLRVPPEDGPPIKAPAVEGQEDEIALKELLTFLRSRTGRDFSCYKRATVLRRIARRMQVNSVTTLQDYLGYLRTHPGEAGALQQDLLISVTNFFRDREAFEALEKEIPKLFEGKGVGHAIRAWTAGCATGEEAYSVAMLLLEEAGRQDSPPTVQVFATDLAEEVIGIAREGLYPLTIAADVSEERLRRFFIKEHRGYRAKRELRECVLFAVHDLLRDAPFSRLDLVTCRNLLIYLATEAQERVFQTLHFALQPKGLLFIGSSESVDEETALWSTIDKKHCIYRRKNTARANVPVPLGPSTLARAMEARDHASAGPYLHGLAFSSKASDELSRHVAEHEIPQLPWDELHFRLIERYAPPSLIVNSDYDIAHMSENAGQFLQFSGGEATTNLLKLIHPMLRVELRAALFRATQSNSPAEAFRVPVELNGRAVAVDIRVMPLVEIGPDYLLIFFEIRESEDIGVIQARKEAEPAVRHLEREIEQLKRRLRDTVEEYEASTEELKASNEELQAMNEELRSSAEELETSREELQSVNEELTTVNSELKSNVDDLGRANSDLSNLMAARGLATIFLNRSLMITRYTPSAVDLFRLIPSDVGRPLTDLSHALHYPEMKEDAEKVLETLVGFKREVTDGTRWYLAQLIPYRTDGDRIAGLVLTFIDITETRLAQHKLREAEERMRFAMEAGKIYAWEFDTRTLKIVFAGNTEPVVGFALPTDLNGLIATVHPEDRGDVAEKFEQADLARGRFVAEFRVVHPETGESVWLSSHGLFREFEDGSRFVGIAQNVTRRKQAEMALRESQALMRLIVENAREYAIFSLDLDRTITSWNSGAQRILGYTVDEAIGQSGDMIFTPEDRKANAPDTEVLQALTEDRAADERWHIRKDGTRFWGSGVMMAMRDSRRNAIGFVKIFRDQTSELHAKEALEKSSQEIWNALQETERARAEAEAAGRAKDQFLAVLSHELRTPLTPVLMAVRGALRRPGLPPAIIETLEMIERNVQLEAHFIDDLLDITRIAQGKLAMAFREVDVHEMVRKSITIAQGDFDAKEQHLTLQLDAPVHTMKGDQSRLQQVFWNLLKNASKFTPNGGDIRVRTRNLRSGDDAFARIVIEVSDTGIGLKADEADRILEAFTQANSSIVREFGGLGLGLAISRATVEAHGGTIHAESPGPSQGTVFIVNLPLQESKTVAPKS